MGTEIQVKSNLLGHYTMRDLNENSNICSWPPYPGDSMLPNGHYYNGYLPRAAAAEVYPGLGKDMVKQTMLEHEAVFRKQVLELHRLYIKQKELMNDLKRKEMFKGRMPMPVETSLASSPLASQITSEDVTKWRSPIVPLVNSSYNNLRPFASVAEGIQSPASSARVNITQAADVPSPIGFGIKSSEILESTRPSKVRRRMFDLRLPADQYIDGDEPEQVKDDKFPEVLATPPKEDARAEHQNGEILAGDGWRTDKEGQIIGPRSYSGVGSVADLNKPLEVDETSGSAHVNPHGNSLAQSSNLGSCNDISSYHSVIGNNGRGWLCILEAGEGKGKKSVSKGDQLQKSLVSEVATEQNQSLETRIRGVDTAESDNCPESVMSSHLSPHYRFGSLHDPAKSWSRSVANFERQGSCSFNQKMPSQNVPSLETTSSSYMKVPPLGINQGGSGDKQQFHPGSSSSGTREPSSRLHLVAYDNYGCRSESAVLKELVRNRNDENHHRRSATLVDLNATLLNGPSSGLVDKMPPWLRSETGFNNEVALMRVDLNAAVLGCSSSDMVDKVKMTEDRPKIPPWLKPEMGFRNADSVRAGSTCTESISIHSSANHDLGRKNEAGRGLEGNKMLSRSIASVSYSDDVETNRNNRGQCPSDKRILDRRTRLLDINLPCDSVSESAKGSDLKVSHCIDLNLIVSEDEASAMHFVPRKMGKRIPEIDLEAPAVPDEEFVEENGEKSCRSIDEGMTSAAEAMVAISSFTPDEICFSVGCMEDPLNWFADVAVSCLNDVEMKSSSKYGQTRQQDGETTSEEIDDFESMTLKLTETKSEDYLPKPFDIPREDESAANPTSSRPRRGQARRGRQRRDFQRDILPGLASLSRHEVTEDLQTFGGLMRATGHAWQSGLTRRNSRNGSARGRRRTLAATSAITSRTAPTYAAPPLVQHLSAVDAGIEDRSLTSWGKTTRRPRRQRCPSGNPPSSIPVMQS